jgi:hypothetical protein
MVTAIAAPNANAANLPLFLAVSCPRVRSGSGDVQSISTMGGIVFPTLENRPVVVRVGGNATARQRRPENAPLHESCHSPRPLWSERRYGTGSMRVPWGGKLVWLSDCVDHFNPQST